MFSTHQGSFKYQYNNNSITWHIFKNVLMYHQIDRGNFYIVFYLLLLRFCLFSEFRNQFLCVSFYFLPLFSRYVVVYWLVYLFKTVYLEYFGVHFR